MKSFLITPSAKMELVGFGHLFLYRHRFYERTLSVVRSNLAISGQLLFIVT